MTNAVARSPLFLVLVLWVAGLGAAAQFAKIAVVFPEVQAHFQVAGTASGFLVSLISFAGMLFGVVGGMLAIRLGLRRLLIVGLVLGAGISAFQSMMPAFAIMLMTRFAEGLSHLAIVVSAPTLIAQLTPSKYQPLALTLWGTFFGVSFAGVALLAPSLTGWAGLPGLFAAHAALMVVLALLVAWVIPPAVASREGGLPSVKDMIRRHRDVYSSPFISAPGLGWLFYTLTFVSFLAVMPAYFAPGIRPFLTAALPVASIVSSLTIGAFLLRLRPATDVFAIGMFLSGLSAASLWFDPADAWLSLCLFIALGLCQGAGFAAVPQLNGQARDQALANGGLAQMGNLGNLLGTPIAVSLIGIAGIGGFPAFLIACYGSAIVVHAVLERRRRHFKAKVGASSGP